jgi:hypothetical protein
MSFEGIKLAGKAEMLAVETISQGCNTYRTLEDQYRRAGKWRVVTP